MACLCHLPSTLTNTDDISKVDLCHQASTLTNTNDKAEDLAVYYQAYIYRFGNTLSISCPSLKAV